MISSDLHDACFFNQTLTCLLPTCQRVTINVLTPGKIFVPPEDWSCNATLSTCPNIVSALPLPPNGPRSWLEIYVPSITNLHVILISLFLLIVIRKIASAPFNALPLRPPRGHKCSQVCHFCSTSTRRINFRRPWLLFYAFVLTLEVVEGQLVLAVWWAALSEFWRNHIADNMRHKVYESLVLALMMGIEIGLMFLGKFILGITWKGFVVIWIGKVKIDGEKILGDGKEEIPKQDANLEAGDL